MLLRLLPLFFILVLTSCRSFHTFQDDHNKNHALEYCGGELWGYGMPLGIHETGRWWTRSSSSPKPFLAVFMHMHSVIAPDPDHTLTFHFNIRTQEDLKIHFPDPHFSVQIDDGEEKKFKLNLNLIESPWSPEKLYPHPEYKIELVDANTNKWRVSKRNQLFYPITSDEKIVDLPTGTGRTFGNEPIQLAYDKSKYEYIYVMAITNIWPEKQPLRDATIKVKTPEYFLNGATYPTRTYTFMTNYSKVLKLRPKYGRCPSTNEIFNQVERNR